MGLISLTLPNDGETVDAADVNTPFNTIATVINGNIENANIKSDAAIDGTKLADNSIPTTKMKGGAEGWTGLANNPSTITYNGNRNYDLVFNAVDISNTVSPGMKLKLTRTVAAPTQCTDLESSSSQYFSRTSASVQGMTFTDDFVCSAWIKLESYTTGSIASRFNGTSGWDFQVVSDGRVTLIGYNGGASNLSQVTTYASLPLNKWVHVSAQLDMSAFAVATDKSYIMFDGVDVSAAVSRGGTNPTSLVQLGNLEIGGRNGGLQPFDGKLAQVAIFNAKVTQATMRTYMSQGLSGSETSLISAFSLSGATGANDLNTTNANNLTANGSATTTTADAPFANAVTAGTEEYAEINSVTFSTNTTVNVRVPETCMIPTSGGISNTYYSVGVNPYGLPYFTKVIGLALNAVGHGSITSSATIALNGLASTVYLPANSKVKITVSCGSSVANSGGNGQTIIVGGITDITVTNNRICEAMYQAYAAGSIGYLETSGIYQNTTAGSVTFYGGTRVSANTGTITSDNTRPAYLRIELV